MADASRLEMIRRAYFGALVKLCRRRYGGDELPNDDCGRECLFDLLCLASLAMTNPAKKMANVIELMAPWMDAEEAEETIEHVNRSPLSERWRIAKTLGERHRVTYAEHTRFTLKAIVPCDRTARELAELRKARKRDREKARRRKGGRKPRAEYLAQFSKSTNQTKPWIALGQSKASFYRGRAKQRRQQRDDHPAEGAHDAVSPPRG